MSPGKRLTSLGAFWEPILSNLGPVVRARLITVSVITKFGVEIDARGVRRRRRRRPVRRVGLDLGGERITGT